jgi:hypothetical protein
MTYCLADDASDIQWQPTPRQAIALELGILRELRGEQILRAHWLLYQPMLTE